MYRRFDTALKQALTDEFSLYGVSDRSLATATARRAASENRVKAMNEATLGKAAFAYIHDTASTRYHQDAELMASGNAPRHHTISYYLSIAKRYRKSDTDRHVNELTKSTWIQTGAAA
jgi:hypothetical protein